MKLHTLVFDLDDTLFAESEYVASGFRAVDAALRSKLQIEGFSTCATTLFAAGRRGRIFDEALLQLGVQPVPPLVQELVAVYRSHTPSINLLPDAAEVLAWAQPRFHLALVSDGDLGGQQRKVAALRLAEQIPLIVLTDAWGREFWKPSPRGFEAVMERYPGSFSGYLYVADNPKKDFLAPRRLGWKTVRIRRAGGEHFGRDAAPLEAADMEISDLRELVPLLESARQWTVDGGR